MSADSAPINLTDHFLIAMPGLSDELFGRSVVYMCEHSEQGALGLVINKPGDISLAQLFGKVELSLGRQELSDQPVFQGGPVQTERGFVLHEAVEGGEGESVYASTMTIPGGLEMTTSRDVLEAMASGGGPRKVFVTLGYASWGQGQLESEITENSWLTVAADHSLIFDAPVNERYDRAMALLGLQSWMLSPDAGHA
jgi:putative transcriptional regulator